MIKVPNELAEYVDFERGKVVAVDLPDKLRREFEKFKKSVEVSTKEDLTDY